MNEDQYREQNLTWHREDSVWKAHQIARVLANTTFVSEFRGKRISVADVGCGVGGVIGSLSDEAGRVGVDVGRACGFDIAQWAVSQAKIEFPWLEFFCEDFCRSEQLFDLVLLMDVLEHVPEPEAFVRAVAARAIYLVIHFPLDDNVLGRLLRRPAYRKNSVGHLHYFHPESAKRFVRGAGLETVNNVYTPAHEQRRRRGGPRPALQDAVFYSASDVLARLLRPIGEPAVARLTGAFSFMVLATSRVSATVIDA